MSDSSTVKETSTMSVEIANRRGTSSSCRKRNREVQDQVDDVYENTVFNQHDIVLLSPFYPSGVKGKGVQRGGVSDQFVIWKYTPMGEEVLQVKDTHAVK